MEAWQKGLDGNNITIKISDVDQIAKTFTLVVEWKPQLIKGIKLTDLPNKLQGSGFVLTVSKPKPGGDYALPAPGTIVLGGGADVKAASTAKAIAVGCRNTRRYQIWMRELMRSPLSILS